LGIEADWPTQHFGRDLVFLQRNAGMIEGVFREVAEESAERF
jgi:hypothetical protein